MKLLGNLIWWLFGGLEAAFAYFFGSIVMLLTIVGIPVALQTFKLGLLSLWPFGAEVTSTDSKLTGCIALPLNIIWIIFGGFWAFLTHIFFAVILAITIIGLPFARQHIKLAGLSLAPFGKNVKLNFEL